MPLHLMKVAVGAKIPEDVAAWQKRLAARGRVSHVTRMWPKRAEEVLDGGSLYWAVAKSLCLRQRIVGFEPQVVDGTRKCRILLDPELVPTRRVVRRPFQGWRYLEAAKAPPDAGHASVRDEGELDETLAALGLL